MKFTELTKQQLTESFLSYIEDNSMTVKEVLQEQMFTDEQELRFIYEVNNDVERTLVIFESVLHTSEDTIHEKYDKDNFLLIFYEYTDETLMSDLLVF